jgi:hypothetical protein
MRRRHERSLSAYSWPSDSEQMREGATMAEDFWEEFGVRIGPFGISVGSLGQAITHTRTETSHLLRIRMSPEVKKEAIKVRLVRPGLLEIEWPRSAGEEIRID